MKEIKSKLRKILSSGNWSEEEQSWLLQYLEETDTAELQQIMNEQFEQEIKSAKDLSQQQANDLLNQIHLRINVRESQAPIVRMKVWKKLAVAVSVLLVLSTGLYFSFFQKSNKGLAQVEKTSVTDQILPGTNKAILTLADGTEINLDEAKKGLINQDGNTTIQKLEDGKIAYYSKGENKDILYNNIQTPRGGQYQVTLSDGTKAWLNAASSIRYPQTFVGKERRVEIKGEVYFEVASVMTEGKKLPFVVDVAGKGQVEVLGTHFNINAYADETVIKTTLLEGKVKMTERFTQHSQLILPGQQAQLTDAGELVLKTNVDIDNIMAWKNGLFDFNRVDVKTIMRQISRWYDIDVAYVGNPGNETFSGIVNRNSDVKDILKIMEKAGVQFNIEGKKIIVK